MNEYLEWMSSNEYKEMAEAEDKFFTEHWANDLLDAPHALISVIETKISRAVLAERRRTTDLAWNWISEMRGHDSYCNCRHEATILQQFIEHSDFTEEQSE